MKKTADQRLEKLLKHTDSDSAHVEHVLSAIHKTDGKENSRMGIMVNLDVMMAKRKLSLGELAKKVDITMANLSILKNNKARAIRFSTLAAICKALDCQPGDILEFVTDKEEDIRLK